MIECEHSQQKMTNGIWLSFLFFLHFICLGCGIYVPFVSKCYPDKKQVCEVDDDRDTDPASHSVPVRFYLFTRANRDDPEMLHLCNGRLPDNTRFNPDKKLLVLLPGFLVGFCAMSVFQEIKDAWLMRSDYNVLVVDDTYAYGANYAKAVKNSVKIAKLTARVLQNIQDETCIQSENVHLIGMSLGAQTAGQIGRLFKVGRITGLDPAGPLFPADIPEDLRLDKDDADLVDVIHCNAMETPLDTGIPYAAGDADFYPNGGHRQPPCTSSVMHGLKKLDFTMLGTLAVPSLCSHAQCLYYYYLSVNKSYGTFIAWNCDNYEEYEAGECSGNGIQPVTMGFEFEASFTPEMRARPHPRKYYLDTLDKWPYVKSDGLPNKPKL